ncbi:hypothetical protein BJ170DRAFT_685306 [Xylariales sp. AK1849]|nr:hypothetical protein BJ170DRAFT_685306 [Xylariales sp. AK1849]
MAEVPVIQILDKQRYFTQHLVSLPDEVPYSPLTAPSTLRLRTKVMCLTINNLTYARFGFLLHWWDVHPLPPTTPAPYNDAKKYGRMNCWGYAEVLDSTLPSVPKGSYLWGYLPLGTLAQDVEVREGSVPGQVFVTSGYRQQIMPIYNRYIVHPASLKAEIEKRADGPAYDAMIRIMFETAYLTNRFVFAAEPKETVHPSRDLSLPWGPEQADLSGATVIVLAPGSKTGLAFAHELRHGRSGANVKRIIGAASEFSRNFVKETGVYDEVVSTSDSPTDILSGFKIDSTEKVMMIDFGGRAGVGAKWASAISGAHSNFQTIGVGNEIEEATQDEVLKSFAAKAGSKAVSVNADDMRNRAIEKVGEKRYFDDLEAEWDAYKKAGIKGFKVTWGDSMEDVKQGWDKLCKGEATPDVGLVYVL